MQRREFITLIWRCSGGRGVARGAGVGRIGVLVKHGLAKLVAHTESDPEIQVYLAAFREGLQRIGRLNPAK
jgi:hypothetical protein